MTACPNRYPSTQQTRFNQLTFDNPLLHKFIALTEAVHTSHQAYVVFSYGCVGAKPFLGEPMVDNRTLTLGISCIAPDWQLFVPSAGL